MAEHRFDITLGDDHDDVDAEATGTAPEAGGPPALPADLAGRIVAQIEASKLAVEATYQGDRVRVTSRSKDDLQETIALVRAQDYPAVLRFTNLQ